MSAPPVALEFAGRRTRFSPWGALLLLIGLAGLALACLEYRQMTARRATLEQRLAAALRQSSHIPGDRAFAARLMDEAARISSELGTPWTTLLTELETASQQSDGQIALLSVEPDQEKHRVRINAEARDLAVALAYLQRLQSSRSLRYPMLESHEVRADDKDHPVRFAMTADWQESP
jgi:hypothetical protein